MKELVKRTLQLLKEDPYGWKIHKAAIIFVKYERYDIEIHIKTLYSWDKWADVEFVRPQAPPLSWWQQSKLRRAIKKATVNQALKKICP